MRDLPCWARMLYPSVSLIPNVNPDQTGRCSSDPLTRKIRRFKMASGLDFEVYFGA